MTTLKSLAKEADEGVTACIKRGDTCGAALGWLNAWRRANAERLKAAGCDCYHRFDPWRYVTKVTT